MDQEKIGLFIAKCRKEKKLTQQTLAEKLGISDKTIGNWENGRNMPDLSLFIPLCKELDITINELISGEHIKQEEIKVKSEENILKTFNYFIKKITKWQQQFFECAFLIGLGLIIISFIIFPKEFGLDLVYITIGLFISIISFYVLSKKYSPIKRLLVNITFIIVIIIFINIVEYITVVTGYDTPIIFNGFCTNNNSCYYNQLFYDTIICNKNKTNEKAYIVHNKQYDYEAVTSFCQNKKNFSN